MRLNRSTLILVAVSIIVIVGVLLLNNTQVEAPTATAVPTAVRVTVFSDLDATTLTSLQVVDNETEDRVVLTREGETWNVSEASFSQDLATDSEKAQERINTFATMESLEQFTVEDETKLAPFGLDTPTHTITASDDEGNTYTLEIGDRSRVSQRFYALVNGDKLTVHQFTATKVQELTNMVDQPPYVPSPTPTSTFTSTPNPYSEVQQTETAEAAAPTMTAEFLTAIAPPEATEEATAEPTEAPAETDAPTTTPSPRASATRTPRATATNTPAATETDAPTTTPSPRASATRTPRATATNTPSS